MAPITTPSYDAVPQKPLTVGLLESVNSLWVLCSKHASRVSKKLASSTNSRNSPRSPLARSKKLFTTISHKAIHFRLKKKPSGSEFEAGEVDDLDEGFGDGGLWQREILMGDKCQPLDFSGVIYYDSNGTRVSELPMRSPRASPLPRYAYTTVKQEQ